MKCPVCEIECGTGAMGYPTDCPECRIYFCKRCCRWWPWEVGCAHEREEDTALCDECWGNKWNPIYRLKKAFHRWFTRNPSTERVHGVFAYYQRKRDRRRLGYLTSDADWDLLEKRDRAALGEHFCPDCDAGRTPDGRCEECGKMIDAKFMQEWLTGCHAHLRRMAKL